MENQENSMQLKEDNKMEIDVIKEQSKDYEENLTSEAKINEDNNINTQIYETENNLMELEAHMAQKYESTAEKDLLSEMKSELKALDAGYDTLTLIEQIEMFNSLNSSFLNKNSIFLKMVK